MRVLAPDSDGYVVSDGFRIHYDVTGAGSPTILLLPTWTVVHKRLWKAQVPYLSRHFRVVTYDGPGNGLSDRPLDSAAYDHDAQVRHARAVLDATGVDRAVVVGLSQGGAWALQLAAEHGDRVLGSVLICPSLPITDGHEVRLAAGLSTDLPPSRVPFIEQDPPEHWAKYDPAYWQDHHEDFLWFFFGMCFPEPHSTKQVEDCVALGARHHTRGARRGGRRERVRASQLWRSGVGPSRAPCSPSTATMTWSARPRAHSGWPS